MCLNSNALRPPSYNLLCIRWNWYEAGEQVVSSQKTWLTDGNITFTSKPNTSSILMASQQISLQTLTNAGARNISEQHKWPYYWSACLKFFLWSGHRRLSLEASSIIQSLPSHSVCQAGQGQHESAYLQTFFIFYRKAHARSSLWQILLEVYIAS